VGVGQIAFAPGIQEIAVTIKDHQWMIAAIEQIDPVLGVGHDGRLA
jgi:hypothetical protein